jgi:hypothetical protein
MNKTMKLMGVALVALSIQVVSPSAFAFNFASESVDHALLQKLAQLSLKCAHQPVSVSRTGNKVLNPIESHCSELQISADRAEFSLEGRHFTILVKDSALADGGDLNDVYLQYDSREDQEVAIASTVLAFGDPVSALLMSTGQSPDQLPQVTVPNAGN